MDLAIVMGFLALNVFCGLTLDTHLTALNWVVVGALAHELLVRVVEGRW